MSLLVECQRGIWTATSRSTVADKPVRRASSLQMAKS